MPTTKTTTQKTAKAPSISGMGSILHSKGVFFRVWAPHAKKIFVSVSQKNHHIEMNISDNGKGFDTTKIFGGNGMNTLKKRATDLSAYFKIASDINKGTAVQLRFKIT